MLFFSPECFDDALILYGETTYIKHEHDHKRKKYADMQIDFGKH